jgi:prevent-host-death family protein
MSPFPTFSSPPKAVQVAVRSDAQIAEVALTEVHLSRDVRPLTDFRANAAAYLERVRLTNHPMILTQHGRSAAVLLGIDAYERLLDEVELLRDVRTAEEQVAAGQECEHERVEARLRAMHGR